MSFFYKNKTEIYYFLDCKIQKGNKWFCTNLNNHNFYKKVSCIKNTTNIKSQHF